MQHWEGGFYIGILGQVWYLIVSIPDLCILTYFYQVLTNDDSGLTLTYFTMATMLINGKTLKNIPTSALCRFRKDVKHIVYCQILLTADGLLLFSVYSVVFLLSSLI